MKKQDDFEYCLWALRQAVLNMAETIKVDCVLNPKRDCEPTIHDMQILRNHLQSSIDAMTSREVRRIRRK